MNIVQEGYYEVCKELGKKDMTNLIFDVYFTTNSSYIQRINIGWKFAQLAILQQSGDNPGDRGLTSELKNPSPICLNTPIHIYQQDIHLDSAHLDLLDICEEIF